MSNKSIGIPSPLYDYLLSVSLREPPILQQLRQETVNLTGAIMQITPDQGQLMGLLVKLMGVEKALEIGVYTGYSSTCIAMAMPEHGKLIACDISEEYTNIARRYWRAAGVEHKIDLRLAPALETLDDLIANGQTNSFDLVFIDADKRKYSDYYERSLQLLRPGGLIIVDNVLWWGKVVDAAVSDDRRTKAIDQFNRQLHQDERVTIAMLPVSDGITLAMKNHSRGQGSGVRGQK